MSLHKPAAAAVSALLLFANTTSAESSSVFDPRTLAMGSTGVASGHSTEAAFMNPALLAVSEDRFSFSLPIGVRLSDSDKLLDAIDDFNNASPVAALNNAIDAYLADPSATTATEVQASGEELIHQLNRISNRPLNLEARAGTAVNIPGKKFGFSVFGNAYTLGGAAALVNGADITAIEDAISGAALETLIANPTDALTSRIDARLAAVTEAGVAIATQVDALGGLAIGVTPKYMQVRSYDYSFVGSNLDNAKIKLKNGEHVDSGFNMDFGLAKEWDSGWAAGLAVRNLIAHEYHTVQGNIIKIKPHARLGASHHSNWLTLAADIDLTEQDAFGVDNAKSRYAGVGAEFDIFSMVQLRAGYRHNLSDLPPGHKAGVASVGLGLSFFGVHTDIAVAGNQNDITGSAQIGFRY